MVYTNFFYLQEVKKVPKFAIQNGADITNILIVFALVDIILGVSWRLKDGCKLSSRIFLSGIVQNVGLSLLPLLMQVLEDLTNNDVKFYQLSMWILGVFIILALIQSIIANALLCGLKLPARLMTVLQSWLSTELKFKKGTKVVFEESEVNNNENKK